MPRAAPAAAKVIRHAELSLRSVQQRALARGAAHLGTCTVPPQLTSPIARHYHSRLGHVVRDRPRRQHGLRRAAAVAAPLAGARWRWRRTAMGARMQLLVCCIMSCMVCSRLRGERVRHDRGGSHAEGREEKVAAGHPRGPRQPSSHRRLGRQLAHRTQVTAFSARGALII